VPVDGNLQSLHGVQNIDNHFVALTNLQHVHQAKQVLEFVFVLTLVL
jgi:hypothetical protein